MMNVRLRTPYPPLPSPSLFLTVRNQVAPQVGKVIQDLLKLSDETDLDILNHSMDVMVEQFQMELLPVAAQLTQRLVSTMDPVSS